MTGSPGPSETVRPYGRLPTVRLRTDVTPVTLLVHEPKVSPVSDSVAEPGAAGLVSTVAESAEVAQVTPVVLVAVE